MLEGSADKLALRQSARRRRDALPALTRAACSRRIIQHVQQWLDCRPAEMRVALYRPMSSEVDVWPLFAWCAATGRQAFAPRIEGDGVTLRFVPVDANTVWRPAKGGFEAPEGQGVELASMHVAFVPGLLFDDAGFRLGYGGGHYDRALLKPPAYAIGIGFNAQRVGALPTEPHDMRLDAYIDEAGLRLHGGPLRQTIASPRDFT